MIISIAIQILDSLCSVRLVLEVNIREALAQSIGLVPRQVHLGGGPKLLDQIFQVILRGVHGEVGDADSGGVVRPTCLVRVNPLATRSCKVEQEYIYK